MKVEFCDITMVQNLALVKLYKTRTYKETQTVLDDEKNKGKDPKKDIMSLKKVETKVKYNIQMVEIMAVDPTNNLKLEVGDVVLVDYRKLKDFDLYKDVYLVSLYEFVGKVNLM